MSKNVLCPLSCYPRPSDSLLGSNHRASVGLVLGFLLFAELGQETHYLAARKSIEEHVEGSSRSLEHSAGCVKLCTGFSKLLRKLLLHSGHPEHYS